MARRKGPKRRTDVEAIQHDDTRKNIPTEELREFIPDEAEDLRDFVRWPRDPSLDPQLVWQGKDALDGEELAVPVVPVYIQEKIQPQAIIEDLRRNGQGPDGQLDFFADFNGIGGLERKLEFYQHDQPWSNRMILGDSLLVMTSLAEKEAMRGKVQCIYLDPPYGIRFASNWQVSTRKRDVRDGRAEDTTRQPEQVRAFRDTWKLGIHSYLSYLRDRFVVARDLLSESGSIFVQIGDENVHFVRAVMDEVFGRENFVSDISFRTKIPLNAKHLPNIADHIVWYSRDRERMKFRRLFGGRSTGAGTPFSLVSLPDGTTLSLSRATPEQIQVGRLYQLADLVASGYTGVLSLRVPPRWQASVPFGNQQLEDNAFWCGSADESTPYRVGWAHSQVCVLCRRLPFLGDHKPVDGYSGCSWEIVCSSDGDPNHRALHPHDDGPRRLGARPDLREWDYRVHRGAVGAALDHDRHIAGGANAGAHAADGGPLPLLPPGRHA